LTVKNKTGNPYYFFITLCCSVLFLLLELSRQTQRRWSQLPTDLRRSAPSEALSWPVVEERHVLIHLLPAHAPEVLSLLIRACRANSLPLSTVMLLQALHHESIEPLPPGGGEALLLRGTATRERRRSLCGEARAESLPEVLGRFPRYTGGSKRESCSR